VRFWPALAVAGVDAEFLLGELDAFFPTAADELDDTVRVFFSSSDARDNALAFLESRKIPATAADVPDEDWARRSQENITPVVVGAICVTPPWHAHAPLASASPLRIVIEPSMGFGTGHHATTRLCLKALQEVDLAGKDVLDVGTGSGVLAIAAAALGARAAVGIDNDPDAIRNASENVALNPAVRNVRVEVADVASGLGAATADVVTANLTGALLERAAHDLLTALRPGGTIIVSGLMSSERAAVERAFSNAHVIEALVEEEWVALLLRQRATNVSALHSV
jgi:ribosomal protein L11 methyltransferase